MRRAIRPSNWALGLTRLREAGRHAALACGHLSGGLGHLTAALADAHARAPLARWAGAGLTATLRCMPECSQRWANSIRP